MPWSIVSGPDSVSSTADQSLFRYVVRRGDEEREVFVELTGTVARTEPKTLPSPHDEHVRSQGRSILEAAAGRREPPARMVVSTLLPPLKPYL